MSPGLERSFVALLALLGVNCSSEESSRSENHTSAIELAQDGKVFALATTLHAFQNADARFKETAARASGALFAPFVDATQAPLFASNGTRLRGTCGVTFIAPSHALTAAHCVDGTKADLQNLVVEMYRPAPELGVEFLRATSLSGSFPEFTHEILGPEAGYFVDRSVCRLVSRCSSLYGGPLSCEGSLSDADDIALLYCDDAPGARYGFLEIATQDLPEAEVFLPWKHEIYEVPNDTNDDRFRHYTEYSGDPAQNYHYFGLNAAGSEQNQMLPLVSTNFPDGTPHRKLSSTQSSVSTDLLGCHGSSGSGALQKSEAGLWELLGPASSGNPEHDAYLCNHVPSLDGMSREPGSLGLSYQALARTRSAYAQNRAAIAADCDLFSLGARAVYPHLGCFLEHLRDMPENVDFVSHWAQSNAPLGLGSFAGPVTVLTGQEDVTLSGFFAQANTPYRLGLSGWSARGCEAGLCPRLSVRVDGIEVLSHSFEQAPNAPVPLAADFVTSATGAISLTLSVINAQRIEVSQIAVRPEGDVNDFDSMLERLEGVFLDADRSVLATAPARYVGDRARGFEVQILAGERVIFPRHAIVGGRRWSARFETSSDASLTCGFLDASGVVKLEVDCSSGRALLDDTLEEPQARAAFFVQAARDSPSARIDALSLVSDRSPDSDGDGTPDAIDPCPNGPLPNQGVFEVLLAPASTELTCFPEPSLVTVPLPIWSNACEPPIVFGHVVAVNHKAIDGPRPDLEVREGRVVLPLGTHTIRWEFGDQLGNIYRSLEHSVSVIHEFGARCCSTAQEVVQGGPDDDVLESQIATCAFGAEGEDFVDAGPGDDLVSGGSGNDYLWGGGGKDVLSGAGGDDYIGVGAGAHVTIFAGPGDDTVHARFAASARIFGGGGADVLVASDGPDRIYPGPGAALVIAGAGDDEVTLYDACELTSGARLVGGEGYDILNVPVPPEFLAGAGVSSHGFEEIRVNDDHAYLSECF